MLVYFVLHSYFVSFGCVVLKKKLDEFTLMTNNIMFVCVCMCSFHYHAYYVHDLKYTGISINVDVCTVFSM